MVTSSQVVSLLPDRTGRRLHRESRAAKSLDRRFASDAETKFKIASSRAELFAAFRLIYAQYLRSALTKPNPHRMRVTPYQLLPNTEIFVAMHREQVICTLSLVADGKFGLPMEAIYGQEVVLRRMRGSYLGEVSCLADRQQESGQSLTVTIRLMSLMAQCAQQRGIDELLIAVHPRHAKFYERFTAFQVIGAEKNYALVCDRPAVPLALDLNRAPVDHPRLYQRFFGVPYPDEALQYRPISEELLFEMRSIMEASCAEEAVLSSSCWPLAAG